MKRFINITVIFIISLFLAACDQTADNPQKDETVSEQDSVASLETEPETSEDNDDESNDSETKNTENKESKDLQELKVHYIDAGQADATLFQWSEGNDTYAILYDAGDWNQNDVIQYLNTLNIDYLDLIIISHPHADHIGQLAQIIDNYNVGEVWMSGNENTSQTFQKAISAVLENDIDYDEPRTGDTFDIGSLTIEILHPSSLTGKLNEDSISMMVTYGENKFLFTGDAGTNEEKQMINGNISIDADVLQLGHHGSNTSSDLSFLKAVDPDIAIYSAGTDNSYGHPHEEVTSRTLDEGITLYGTDVHGTIVITTDGNEYDIQTKDEGTIRPKSTNSSQTKEKDNKKSPKQETTTSNCIDINKASHNELEQIIHIGPARSEDIIEKRPYESIDDLTKIDGIGPARIADIKEQGLACTGG